MRFPHRHLCRPRATRHRVVLGLTGVLAAAILVLALIPVASPPPVPGTDKHHHILAFAALTLPAAALAPRLLPRLLPLIAAEAALIEIVQPHVGRQGEWADLAADLKGIALGLALGLILHAAGRALYRRG